MTPKHSDSSPAQTSTGNLKLQAATAKNRSKPQTARKTARKGRSLAYLRLRRLYLKWYRFSDPFWGKARRKWKRSLVMRTTVIMVLTAMVMTTVAGAVILTTVGDDLITNRLQAALNDSARTTVAAQQQIDNSEASDRSGLSNLMLEVRSAIRDTSSSQLIYVQRRQNQPPSLEAPLDFLTGAGVIEAVTPALSEAIATGDNPQVWQYTEITNSNLGSGQTPGVMVATTLAFPDNIGNYNLFIYYSFAETEQSLQLISQTLIISGSVLVLFIALFAWFAISKVFQPVRHTAKVSRELASGNQNARMQHQNDSYFDALADNFNEMADTLNARINELDTLSTMQQRFVSDVSHELRTPLTTIRLASEVLVSADELTPAQARAVQVLSDQVTRFEELLTDLLEISRYDAGRVQLETEPTSIIELTNTVIEQLQPLSQSVIELRTPGGYNALEVDRRRIRRILSNLIGNAIEHGEQKPIIVTIDSNSTALAVTVRDYGIGMTELQTAHVFDRFWRADPSRKRTLGGTGLGLAIAQEDAAVHGGLIDVWSQPQQGTNFRLTLPRRDSDEMFLSPLPLVPEEFATANSASPVVSGWIDRPRRWLLKRGR